MIEALNDEDTNVRYHAVEALGKLKAADAVNALAEIAESRDFFLAFAALDALTRDDMQRLLADVWRETRKTVIYVTHNVAEAVYLADRVVVMSPHPGTVKTEIKINLPRPRDPLSVQFVECQKELLGHLGHDTAQTKANGKAKS